jgi:hypothetical protein
MDLQSKEERMREGEREGRKMKEERNKRTKEGRKVERDYKQIRIII